MSEASPYSLTGSAAGFMDIVIRIDAGVTRFRSTDAMICSMMAGTPLAKAKEDADAVTLQNVVSEVEAGLAEYEDDLGLVLPMQAWVVTAKV